MTIDYFSLGHPLAAFRSRFALQARLAMFDKFINVMRPDAQTTVLDLGVTPDQTLPESNFFEALYPYKDRLTAASIENARFLEVKYPGMRFVHIAPGRLPFDDDEFDIVFSSAVIEHVGDESAQQLFVNECLRVARRFFLTTPNRKFPLDFHTMLPILHWLPRRAHQAALRRIGLHFWAKTENLNLLTETAILRLFPGSCLVEAFSYRLLGLPSNIVVYGEKPCP